MQEYNILSLLCFEETAVTVKDLYQRTKNSKKVSLWILITIFEKACIVINYSGSQAIRTRGVIV